MEKILILDNIRSAHNVGAIFRTADGAGVTKIYLVGYTPTPVDRFGREQPEIKKTSLGASTMVPWEQVLAGDELKLINDLKTAGQVVVAVEQTQTAVMLTQFKVPTKVAYILGNEITGVSDVFLKNADHVIEIPMHGDKESLNVSVSTGIVLYKE